jgi:hypothetical protein
MPIPPSRLERNPFAGRAAGYKRTGARPRWRSRAAGVKPRRKPLLGTLLRSRSCSFHLMIAAAGGRGAAAALKAARRAIGGAAAS